MLGIRHFVNADTLARGLSAFYPDDWAIKAGKIMLEHLHELARQRLDFAFETTLASRTFASWIENLKQDGYRFHLIYLWLPTAEMAVQRVRERVSGGGHDVPVETIHRRYQRGLENFFRLYRPLADTWQVFDNSNSEEPRRLAEGDGTMETVVDPDTWKQLQQGVNP
jgi:predicted ABC-type ATPase